MRKKKRFKKRRNRKEIIAGLILLFVSCLFLYQYFFVPWTDTSLNGSEIKERTQHFIPEDVKQEIEQQRKLYTLTELPVYRVPVLMYHYIEPQDPNDKIRASLTTNPFTLEEQIKTLKGAGFTFLTNAQLALVIEGKRNLPKKPILLTFDDGYRDFYTDAYPILKRHHTPATEYVIAGYLDHPNHLLTSELLEISRDGLVEIGAHTVTHDWLKDKLFTEVGYQVSESKKILEKITGKKIVSFAYPYGAFDNLAIQIVKAAKYKSAVSTIPGIMQSFENKFFLYRLRPGARTGEELLSWLSQTTFKPY